jgi:putative membrane-bound dehydrogenase-like protein
VFTGFATNGSTQLYVNHPTLGLDNWVYLAGGLSGGNISSPDFPQRPALDMSRVDFRFRPDTDQFELADGKSQFGMAFDDFGNRFICMNRVQAQHVVLPSRYLRRNPHLSFSSTVQNLPERVEPEPLKGHGAAARIFPISHNITTADSHAGTFTAACSVFVNRGTALPREFYGNVFSCDPAGNLVHRDLLAPKSATFIARRAREGIEPVASSDDWFRPVYLANGPDGALYICDMYRGTIEHPVYLPEEIRKRTSFEGGKDKGRIYRVTGANWKAKRRKINLDRASTKELCAELSNPDGWWRDTAQRLLIERHDRAAIPFLKSAMRNPKSKFPASRLHALHTLAGLDALDDETILRALVDPLPAVREHAIHFAEERLPTKPAWLEQLLPLADDPDPRVRFQCALTVGDLSDARIMPALAKIATRDAQDRWTRAAVLSSSGTHGEELLRSLLSNAANSSEGKLALLSELGRCLAAGEPKEKLLKLLGEMTEKRREEDFSSRLSALAGFAEGLRTRGLGGHERSPLMSLLTENSETSVDISDRVAAMTKRSVEIALDAQAPVQLRLNAVSLLGQADFSVAGGILQKLIDPIQPADLQNAAVRALGQMADPAIGPSLLRRGQWNVFSPPIREAVLQAILSQPRHLPGLLSAIERGEIPASGLDSARRNQLMKHRDESIRLRAEALFKNMEAGDRMKVYQDYKSVLALRANPANGRAVFKIHCASCHRLDREGVPIGPDLFGIRNQPKEAILLHVIVPEYEIAPNFTNYNLETKDGRTLSGLIGSETGASITLRRALGEEEIISRNNLESISASALSLMPQELEKNMSRQDLADLLAYLKGE